MKSQIEIIIDVGQKLENLTIPYFVGGSIASSLFGFNRATADVDIAVNLQSSHIKALYEALKDEFYIDDLTMRRAVANRSMFNALHSETLFKVDFHVLSNDDYSCEQLTRRQAKELLPDTKTYFASPEDVILSKLRWHKQTGGVSERQLTDAAGILKNQREQIDYDYLKEWATRLGVSDLLKKVLGER